MTENVWTLRCCQAKCDETATHVAVQPHALAMLFPSYASVLCYTHANAYRNLGAAVVLLESFATLAQEGSVS